MIKKISVLNNRSIIEISGSDRINFLNNILTNDILNLQENEICPSALLTPQGKILFDFLTFITNKGHKVVYIECSKGQKNELINKLKLYSLRQNIKINETELITIVTNNLSDFRHVYKDVRFYKTYIGRTYLKKNEFDQKSFFHFTEDHFWYHYEKIKNCVLEGEHEVPSNKLYPFEIGMNFNNGISFEKGCFIGQEVIARVKYKGNIKKYCCGFESLGKVNLNSQNNSKIIKNDDFDLGEIIFINNFEINTLGFCLIKSKYLVQNDNEFKCFYNDYPLVVYKPKIIN